MTEQLLSKRLVAFINSSLLPEGATPVHERTQLFEVRVLDSLRVLDLIAFVERETGRAIPDSAIRLTNFATAQAIAATALGAHATHGRDDERIWSRSPRVRHRSSGLRELPDVDAAVRDWAGAIAAEELEPPALVSVATLQRARYLSTFPGRVVLAHPDDDSMHGGDLALPPAACLHCYEQQADRRLTTAPLFFTLSSRCARGDEVVDPMHGRLTHFTMREVVCIGSPRAVDSFRRDMLRRTQTFVTRLDLAASIESATDPFHAPADRGRKTLQRLRALKYELLLPVNGQPVAVASFNDHEDFFGRSFNITLPDGSHAHSGCVAFGLERWDLALRARRAAAAMGAAS
ncbi:hypothetical protein BH23GEM2_BH23GEM2_02010 [soil metagenome]